MSQVLPLDGCVGADPESQRIALVRDRVPDDGEAGALAALFRLLGDVRRTKILYALLEAGELCVCDISAAVQVPEASVSQTMRLLRASAVVDNRREGRRVYYRLADAHVRMLLDVCRAHTGHEVSR
ncbi:helix-turn-helix transcriptional regulator [Actinotalea ferrariae]|uniref:ArsR/SmtB family transcription factor n=1 Tax=Actinotalea ferrariae TaxID=1386098 RepID=UPI001C8BE20D|nr:metalloregulator ArsR/SmtB family transcription factor [Actinotalea ferrariae]MBX9243614.1 helix-turn-helix transcriptional regulator [Actinotalea ferrariae]